MTEPANLEEAFQNVERDRRSSHRQKMWLLATAVLLFIAAGIIAVLAWQLSISRGAALADAASEQQQKQEYAQELQTVVCETNDVEIFDADRCAELTAATKDDAATGPKGDKGDPGRDGRDGRDGVDGIDGEDGNDSTTPGAPGMNGLNGAAGKDGEPGPIGPPGKDGAPGINGKDGANGRGISSVICEGSGDASYWVVTYDDGTSQTSTGPCRLTTLTLPTGAP